MPKAIVDLSPTLGEDIPTKALGVTALEAFGIPPTTKFELQVTEEPFYVEFALITLFNHVGPHHDPPSHVIKVGESTDQIPLDRFYGPAKIFDFRSKAKDEPLLPSDFENQGVKPGDIVIVLIDYDAPTVDGELPSYAYLSGEAAEYLAGIPIKAFASNMPSLGSIKRYFQLIEAGLTGSENIVPEHYAFLSRDIPNIEGLANLESLVGEEEIVFVGFPLKIKDGNGAPLRAAALVY
jgi:kynurenine formamidase